MIPKHHPSDALLFAHGAGSLPEGLSLALACHFALCPLCRSAADDVDAVGGVLLDGLAPEALGADALERALAALDGDRCDVAAPAETAVAVEPWVPEPLAGYLGASGRPRWQRLGPGIRRVSLRPRSRQGGSVQLFRIAPGTTLPHHGHGSLELTLVLAGSFADEFGRYGPGDIAEADATMRHQPIADSHEDCVCLIATDAKLRFTGLVGRLLQPWAGL